MTDQKDYQKDLAAIRSMMERSSRFLSLSGWAGILAGIYALIGVYIARTLLHFHPADYGYQAVSDDVRLLVPLVVLAMAVLVFTLGTAVFLSLRRAKKRGEALWNGGARRMVTDMAIPLIGGGLFLMVILLKGLWGLLAPLSMLFYGIAIYAGAHHTFKELKFLGITHILLGIAATCYLSYSLLFWALGFGLLHILYGIYVFAKYER
jgi:uncharacterized membrane protein YidH (DUF202 family)